MLNNENHSATSCDTAVIALLEGSADGFCALDRTGRFLYLNRTAERIFGAMRDAVIGRGALEHFGENGLQLRRAAEENTAVDFRFKSLALDEWFDVRACPSGQGLSVHLRVAAATHHRSTDGALNEASADVLAAIGEAVPDFVWVTNAAGDVLYVNRRWIEYTGLSADQTDQRGYVRTIHPVDLPRFLNEVEYAQREGRAIEGEFRYRRHDGEFRWFWVRSTPLKDVEGNLHRRVGVAVDITDRLDASRALRESEARYRGIFDQAALGMCESLVGGKFTAVNQRMCEMLGYTRDELLARSRADITHPDDVPASRAQINALVAGETETFVIEKRYLRKDGADVWARTSVSPVRDEHGRVTHLVAAIQDITAQKRIEAERERSEQLTQHIVEHSPIGIVVADTSGRFMHVNNAWLKMLGYTMEDVRAGRINWKEMTVPEHRHLDERAIELMRTQGWHQPFEKTLIRKDGSRIPCLAATAYLGGPGETGVGFLVDLTEVKRAQEQVQSSEERLRHALDAGNCAIYEWDIDADRMTWSDRLYEFFGVAPEELDGTLEAIMRMIHPDDRERVRQSVQAALEHDVPHKMEHRIVRSDGQVRWLYTNSSVRRDADGRPQRLLGACIDVTERKAADDALRQSEDKYRTLTDAVGSLMWMSDAGGQVCFFNRRWDEYLDGNGSQILGLGWRQFVHPEDLRAIVDERTVALAEGRAYTVEFRLRRHDGAYRWHLTRIVPHKDASGTTLNWFGTAIDIHDLKTAEQAVLQAKAEAEHANKAKDQFLAVLSHELRTPLTPVVMTVAAIEMDRTISPQLREDLAMIRRNIELETKLIDDLLDVTRIANGKLRLQARATDVHSLLKNVLEILKSDIADKQLEMTVDLAAADPAVFADPARLQQVFWNLIKNAIKFTSPGGHVGVRSWNASERIVCVEVIDDGAGIEPAVLPRIFNAFDQGEQTITRQFGGLGLGLAISKALTELHGGSIRVVSDGKGKGACFTIELPTRTPVERIVDQIQPIGPGGASQPRPRVLLVEDHIDTQRTLRRLLEERGYEVFTAGSVAGALAMLAQSPVDVLVSDIGLPDATGYELMRQVRERHQVPGVAVSGFGMDGDLKCSHDAGFAAHMTKPVDINQLDSMIRSLLPARSAAPATEPIA